MSDTHHVELDMQDYIGRMYNRLNEMGYHGGYTDAKTDQLERQVHQCYYHVVAGAARLADYQAYVKEFFAYYKKVSPLAAYRIVKLKEVV